MPRPWYVPPVAEVYSPSGSSIDQLYRPSPCYGKPSSREKKVFNKLQNREGQVGK